MLTNQYTLAQLRTLTAGEIDEIPLDQMAGLLEAVTQAKADAKALDAKLMQSMHRRYCRMAEDARYRQGKTTGRVTLEHGGFAIKADLPKKITWDTPALQAAWHEIAKLGDDPSEIIEVKLEVPEKRWNALTSRMQAVLKPARTEGTGNPSFIIERKGDADD